MSIFFWTRADTLKWTLLHFSAGNFSIRMCIQRWKRILLLASVISTDKVWWFNTILILFGNQRFKNHRLTMTCNKIVRYVVEQWWCVRSLFSRGSLLPASKAQRKHHYFFFAPSVIVIFAYYLYIPNTLLFWSALKCQLAI